MYDQTETQRARLGPWEVFRRNEAQEEARKEGMVNSFIQRNTGEDPSRLPPEEREALFIQLVRSMQAQKNSEVGVKLHGAGNAGVGSDRRANLSAPRGKAFIE